ncbi:MAG TPA: HlyD family efflux transporter periplasmic adaptor subunit [Pseudonocardia sp.]
MRRRTLLLNVALALLVILVLVFALITAFSPRRNTNVERTVPVTRGTVTAAVTATGNAISSAATPVSFLSQGTLTSVAVSPGETVSRGQLLATIDDADARTTLRTAQAQLDGARANLAQASAGPTDVKRQQDLLAITQAQQSLDAANIAVTQAQQQLAIDQTSTDTAIKNAKTKLDNDDKSTSTAVDQAQAKLATDTRTQNALVSQASSACGTSSTTTTTNAAPNTSGSATRTTTPTTSASPTTSPSVLGMVLGDGTSNSVSRGSVRSVSTAGCAGLTNAQNTRRSVLQADQQDVTNAQQNRNATLDTDRQAVTTAQQNQTATLLKDNQAITTNRQQVISSQSNVTSAQLAAQADLHPETPAQIAQVQSTVDSAKASLDQAQRGVDSTALLAPQDGVVLSVAGKVGEVSSGGSASSSSGTTGSTSASSASTSNVGTLTGSGFVVIANLSNLAVTADIAEADASKVQVGQAATVTFPGTSTTATGAVTQFQPQSTVTNNVVQFPVQVSLDTAPPGVDVGSTASMSITTGSKTGVLLAPTSAITTVGNRHTVIVKRNGVDTVVPVQIGLVGDTTTEITDGVTEGDQLVLPTGTATSTTNGFPRGGGGGGGG